GRQKYPYSVVAAQVRRGVGPGFRGDSATTTRAGILDPVSPLALSAAVLLALAGLILVATGVLGLTGRLPGNNFLGVRTPETRKSPDAWRLANRAAGPGFVGAGVMTVAGAAGLLLIGGLIGWLVVALAVVAAVG